MKYPRHSNEERVNWEDVNEVIAAKIAQMLDIKTIKANIAYRDGKRGCLMLNFIDQYKADFGETGASLLSAEMGIEYDELKNSQLKNMELIKSAFSIMEAFSYFPTIRLDFVVMNFFDILIGNQDRHSNNWQILFKKDKSFFGPLYDNGASLGWQLPDGQLERLLDSYNGLNRHFKKMRVKAGIFENTQPPLKAIHVLSYCMKQFPDEVIKVKTLFEKFDMHDYHNYINNFPLISDVRKEFLKRMIEFRIQKILSIIKKEVL